MKMKMKKDMYKKDMYKKTLSTKQLDDTELSFGYNVGINSVYIWRGQTLSNGSPYINGSIDLQFNPGFYLGTWLSTTEDSNKSKGTEVNLYGGYSFEISSIFIDIGYINYEFIDNDFKNLSGGEFYVSVSYGVFSLEVNYHDKGAVDKNSNKLGKEYFNFVWAPDWTLCNLVTSVSFEDGSYNVIDDDKSHYIISISGDILNIDWTIAYNKSKIDPDVDGVSLQFGFGKSFDF